MFDPSGPNRRHISLGGRKSKNADKSTILANASLLRGKRLAEIKKEKAVLCVQRRVRGSLCRGVVVHRFSEEAFRVMEGGVRGECNGGVRGICLLGFICSRELRVDFNGRKDEILEYAISWIRNYSETNQHTTINEPVSSHSIATLISFILQSLTYPPKKPEEPGNKTETILTLASRVLLNSQANHISATPFLTTLQKECIVKARLLPILENFLANQEEPNTTNASSWVLMIILRLVVSCNCNNRVDVHFAVLTSSPCITLNPNFGGILRELGLSSKYELLELLDGTHYQHQQQQNISQLLCGVSVDIVKYCNFFANVVEMITSYMNEMNTTTTPTNTSTTTSPLSHQRYIPLLLSLLVPKRSADS